MTYMYTYSSPLGNIFLAADEVGLTGLRFEGQKYFANTLPGESISQETPILNEAKRWERTDIYTTASSSWFCIQTGCVADIIADSIWRNNDIWRDYKQDCWRAKTFSYVGAGSWWRSGT